jgi:hypothetical protein
MVESPRYSSLNWTTNHSQTLRFREFILQNCIISRKEDIHHFTKMLLGRVPSLTVALAVLATLSIATEPFRYNSSSTTRPSALPVGVTDETTKLNGFNIRMLSLTHLIMPAYNEETIYRACHLEGSSRIQSFLSVYLA